MTKQSLSISLFCKTGSGTTPSRSKQDRYFGGGIPWVKSGELRESIITKTEETVTEEALSETALRIAPKGSVLVAMYGANVGRVGILDIDATTNQAICHIVPEKDKADSRYIFHALQQKLPEFISRSVGGAQPNISQQIIRDTKIFLPPIDQQKRIAAILDKAEELRRMRRQSIEHLDVLSRSIFIEMFGDPVINEKGWKSAKVSNFIAGFETGKSIVAEDIEDITSMYRVLKVSAVTSLDYRAEESKAVPNDYVPPKSHFVCTGDLLFSRANTSELVGATAYVFETPHNLLLPDKIWRFVWYEDPQANPLFVWFMFRHPKFRHEVGKRATGTSGSMKNISQEKVLSIRVGLPPLPLQQEFAQRIESIEYLKTKHRESLTQLDTLFTSLQHRAFRGEL